MPQFESRYDKIRREVMGLELYETWFVATDGTARTKHLLGQAVQTVLESGKRVKILGVEGGVLFVRTA